MPVVVKRRNWVAEFFSIVLFAAFIAGLLTGIVWLFIQDLDWWPYALLFGITFAVFSFIMLFYWFMSVEGHYEAIDQGLIVEETSPTKASQQ